MTAPVLRSGEVLEAGWLGLILLYTPFSGVIAVFSLDDYFNSHR